MSQISMLHRYSPDIFQNNQLSRKYNNHKSKIQQILGKKSSVDNIYQEQKRISQIVNKSRAISRSFKNREFLRQRMFDQSRIKSRGSIRDSRFIPNHFNQSSIQQPDSPKIKQQALRQESFPKFSIQLKPKNHEICFSYHTTQNQKYRRKILKQIKEYEKIKKNLRRFKTLNPYLIKQRSQTIILNQKLRTQQKEQTIKPKRKVLKTLVQENEFQDKKQDTNDGFQLQLLIL